MTRHHPHQGQRDEDGLTRKDRVFRATLELGDDANVDAILKHAHVDDVQTSKVANLDLEEGLCFVQTDDDCTDELLCIPQAVEIPPRCTLHAGSTIRHVQHQEDVK